MLRTWAFAACYVAIHGSSASAGTFDQYDAKAEAIVQSFSPEQLLGQMTQLDLGMIMNSDTRELNETAVRTYAKMYVGSYLNTYFSEPVNGTYGFSPRAFRAMIQRIQEISMEENGGHPIIYGIDSVHGANYVDGSVLFPQQINSAASFNPQLLFDAARVTARDTEAAGISWIFAPILDISQHKLWARTFETFGEDTYLATVMADAIVRGLQSRNQTAACLKHFIAYSKEPTGHDRENVLVSDFDILNTFMPPYKAAMEAGALSVMENYISINGDPVIRSSKLLNGLLRNDLQFDGVLLTDWAEIYNLHDWHRVSASRKEAVATSLMQTSVDVSMVPTDTDFIQYGLTMLEQHPEQLERLRQSVKRVIKLKLGLGLYEKPVPGNEYVTLTGNKQDVATALDMARESIVLVQNNNATLPLPKQASVFLTGPSADDVGYQCGGWTFFWQGVSGNNMYHHGVSVREGMAQVVGNTSFTYFNGLDILSNISDADFAKAVKLASQHEYTVFVVGEATYTEKPGDIPDPALPLGHEKYVEALAKTGTKVIVVLFEGRPRLLGTIPDHAFAIIDGLLPCELGGLAVAEILYGVVNPSGKLPITYPKTPATMAVPYNHLVSQLCNYDECEMQWTFGTGLSYTTFEYSGLTLDKMNLTRADDTVTATVTVTNNGTRAGKETVMLFLIQLYRQISVPEVKRLKKFEKIELQPGESKVVSFTLSAADWGVYKPAIGEGLTKIVEDADYYVAIKPETDCAVYDDEKDFTDPLCAPFTIKTGTGVTTVSAAGPEIPPINGTTSPDVFKKTPGDYVSPVNATLPVDIPNQNSGNVQTPPGVFKKTAGDFASPVNASTPANVQTPPGVFKKTAGDYVSPVNASTPANVPSEPPANVPSEPPANVPSEPPADVTSPAGLASPAVNPVSATPAAVPAATPDSTT